MRLNKSIKLNFLLFKHPGGKKGNAIKNKLSYLHKTQKWSGVAKGGSGGGEAKVWVWREAGW